MAEDATKVITLSGTDIDGTVVSYEAEAIDNCSVTVALNKLTIKPNSDFNGQAKFKVRSKDNEGGYSEYQEVSVTVNSVPSFSSIIF
jgi:hypothetical protein